MLNRLVHHVTSRHKEVNKCTVLKAVNLTLSDLKTGKAVVCFQESVTETLACKRLYSIALVNFHIDTKILYLFTYNTFIKILYMFRAVHCSSSGGLIVSLHHLVSSLSAGDCPVHRLTQ